MSGIADAEHVEFRWNDFNTRLTATYDVGRCSDRSPVTESKPWFLTDFDTFGRAPRRQPRALPWRRAATALGYRAAA
eukprot:scaffold74923_cov30-Tisochrysis_lutea.AAC.2